MGKLDVSGVGFGRTCGCSPSVGFMRCFNFVILVSQVSLHFKSWKRGAPAIILPSPDVAASREFALCECADSPSPCLSRTRSEPFSPLRRSVRWTDVRGCIIGTRRQNSCLRVHCPTRTDRPHRHPTDRNDSQNLRSLKHSTVRNAVLSFKILRVDLHLGNWCGGWVWLRVVESMGWSGQ